ncbi:TPA: sterol desaturase family protein [Pseudomonas aeruginosa]|uniref:sterol desaturase family protein n=1 Tax=Pseudomonas aeruginosa TaxID=287 RepID=UPI000EB567B9|nr:sterol desaturase family protein [Pseudomonas aeruginosa]MBP8508026.1 sterol desaturase family protein [Pseudomonas aeruginosa]MBP8524284.1 sterol desaturase family protein [Pseudomonas aeruginosa]MBV6066278.1 sterol desaturase family protein [Pseudomonas aeruginosa]MBV6166556.1 sterol desaturase family protein [Pseudomonas aeruginosa]MBV6196995.1 sterol desaturase family protein [Pseudomonas aeruginosa]
MQFFLRYAYAPLFWSGFIGLATWQVGYRQASHAWLVALFLGALGLSFLAERRLPYQPRWNRPHADRLRDVLHASVNESLNALGILALPLLAGVLSFWPVWPQAWPLLLQLLLAIVLADLGITLVHYASHRSALLWRLHAVHHSVQRLYGFNGLMKHPLHLGLEALGGTLPLLLLGVPQTVAALLAFAIGIQLLLQHSNVDMRIGGLRHVFAWAPLHRLHHIRYGRAGDVNFALFFSVWDRLLDTALHRPDYRLDSTDMGIGDQPDYPRDYAGQLLAPFRDLPRSRHVPQPPEGLGRSAGQA